MTNIEKINKELIFLNEKQIEVIKTIVRTGFWGDCDMEFGNNNECFSAYGYTTNLGLSKQYSGLMSGIVKKIKESGSKAITHCHDWWNDGSGDMLFINTQLLDPDAIEDWANNRQVAEQTQATVTITDKDLNSLIDYLLKNNGFSFSLTTKEHAKGNYYLVSLAGYERTSKNFDIEAIKAELTRYIYDNWDQLQKPENYLGVWVNDKNRTIYYDISEAIHQRHKTLATVKRIAKERGQIAIWDLVNNRSILV